MILALLKYEETTSEVRPEHGDNYLQLVGFRDR